MSYLSSSINSGNSRTPACPVPAGIQAGDIIILAATYNAAAAAFDPADWPTGFTELDESDNTLNGQTSAVGWRRATGAESGSYTFGIVNTSASDWVAMAAVFRGRHTTDPPTQTKTINNSSNASPVTITSPTITAVAGDDLLHIIAADPTAANIVSSWSAPSGFTAMQTTMFGSSAMAGAYKVNVTAGDTGADSSDLILLSGASAWVAWKVRIPAAAATAFHNRVVNGPFEGPLTGTAQ
jgi:hypothetical protein